jgi:hypothetical protein
LGSDAKIQFIPEAGHGLPPDVMQRMRQTMHQLFLKNYNTDGTKKSS